MVLKVRILFLLAFMFCVLSVQAQVSFDSPEKLEKAANEYFDAGQYAKAKPLFSQLLSKDAMNPNYNYRFGVCVLFTEADPLKPLPYIEGGANSKGVDPQAHYFLGKAYQLNYRFDDAITAYEKAKQAGVSQPNLNLDKHIEECRNGKILYNPAIDFEPAQNKEVLTSEFYRPYDFRRLKGKVIPMPPNFKTKYDQKNLKGTVIYAPTNSQTLVYASYGEDGANAKDLYRVNRLPNGEWALPQRLPNTINTPYDEDYAFFDEEMQTLYFASKGHNTMGGYDVFSSQYNAQANTWSTPRNLQYPVNSPFDDFLYVSDPAGKMAFFTTERNASEGKLRVMKMLLHDAQKVEVSLVEGTFIDQTDSVYNYAALTVYDPKTNEVVGKYRSNKNTGQYLLILPPQNGYRMDVAPKESAGFKFDLNVPKQSTNNALQQTIAYNAQGEDAVVTLTNYFDAAGQPDSVAFAANRPLKEVESKMVALAPPAVEKDAIAARQAEAIALAEKETALAEKTRLDSIAQAKEIALQQQAKKQEKAQKEALAKAEKEKQEAREKAEAEAIALAEKKAVLAEKARLDSIKLKEALTMQQKLQDEKSAQQQALAQAELARLDTVKQKEKQTTTQKTAKELEQELVARALAKTRQDSIEAVRELQELQAKHKAERARRDSIRKAEELMAQAKERTNDATGGMQPGSTSSVPVETQPTQQKEKIARLQQLAAAKKEQELAKQKATDNTLSSGFTAATPDEETKTADAASDTTTQVAPTEPTVAAAEETAQIAEEAQDTTSKVLSESELFLQTIAKLEAQKKEQERLVQEENEARAKALRAKQLAQKQAQTDWLGKAVPSIADSVAIATAPNQDTTTIETAAIALKSDADPEEYLAALNKIEQQIAKDEQANKKKTYELKELNPEPYPTRTVEPLLQEKIDADRAALEAHQAIAAKKERALKEQMQLDKKIVSQLDVNLEDATTEGKSQLAEETTSPLQAESLVAQESSVAEDVQPTSALSTDSLPAVVTVKDQSVEEVMAEFDRLLEESNDSATQQKSEYTNETEIANTNEDALQQDTEQTIKTPSTTSEASEELATDAVRQPQRTVQEEPASTPTELTNDKTAASDANVEVGNIPFMTAALRNYANRKPNFKQIKNPEMRNMIKRMRAEDIGRIAVLKNMKNQWVEAGKTNEALAEIKRNTRNQEVLASLGGAPTAPKEIIRPPFDKTTLRKRQGVHYKIQFIIEPQPASEEIAQAMSAEQAMTFSMPEITLQSGYYQTLADARSELKLYQDLGFESVKIVSYLENEPKPMFDVMNVPFID